MANSRAIWGIDIGQCALKALRCRAHDDSDKIIADAFDHIEYPKILSQPEADPVALVRDALELFLSRNSVRGDRVAVSVPGQNGLARFIKLPPVETKKIPDIVRYEARQQIPFALEDVVWDFQKMAGGMEEAGFALETEVGLFAMKREQVARVLRPFDEAGIEVDIVQLTPLALYNYVAFDQMQHLPPPDQYDPENPPESVVVLAMGTEASDLVVTNGFRVWQRSVPLGGNHFTKALTKDLKLTFARAEHLKRNASHAEDAKAVFQAMRPVFTDLVTEVQRSIGYFTNIDRRAKISRIVALGNAMKLPGLQRFVSQNLGLEVERVEAYRGLTGAEVIEAPTFKENAPAFGVCYGLALQGLRDVRIKTNLIPQEIVQTRLIRSKKPWAVGAAAALMAGLVFSFGGGYRAWSSVHEDRFGPAITKSDSVTSIAAAHQVAYNDEKTKFEDTKKVGINLVHNVEGRVLWVEVLKAVNACLPTDPPGERPAELKLRNQLQVTQIESQHFDDLGTWWAQQEEWYQNPSGEPETGTAGTTDPAAEGGTATKVKGPTGAGWVFQLVGYHFHNGEQQNEGSAYVLNTLVSNLHLPRIELEPKPGQPATSVPVGELGIAFPMLVNPRPIDQNYRLPVEGEGDSGGTGDDGGGGAAPGGAAAPGGGAAPAGGFGAGAGGNRTASAGRGAVQERFVFVVQFCWKETPPSQRGEKAVPSAPTEGEPLAADATNTATGEQ